MLNFNEMMGKTSLSIIVPVLSEEDIINDVIDRHRGLDGASRTEIIVVDCGPDHRTLETITSEDVVKVRSPRGRGRQMNEGAGHATGDILLFLHADTELPLNALSLIENAMQDGQCAAGAFDLAIKSRRTVFRIIEFLASLRSRITRVPFGDQAIFIRKGYFSAIGGYREMPIMEDIEIMKRIRKRGDRIVILRDRVATSPRRWEKEGIVRCTLRNWLLQALYPLGVPARTLARFYK